MPTIRNEVHNNYWGHKRAQKIHSHPQDTFCNCCKWRSPPIGLSFAESAGKAEERGKWKSKGGGASNFMSKTRANTGLRPSSKRGFDSFGQGIPPKAVHSPFSVLRSPFGMEWNVSACLSICKLPRKTHGAIIPNSHSRQSQFARLYECFFFALVFGAV